MRNLIRLALVFAVCSAVLQGSAHAEPRIELQEFRLDKQAMCDIKKEWTRELLKKHPNGKWAEMKLELTNERLAKLGLPPKEVLLARDYERPTLVTKAGRSYPVPMSTLEGAVNRSIATTSGESLITFAGTGCFGIRPGALYLVMSGGSISLCSLAHLYGSAISTAGHCGNTGDTATVIAGLGNRSDATGVVLLDFGTFGASHDNGLGDDYATIGINSDLMHLVTPTMCFWGGPRGVYTKEGAVADVGWSGNGPNPSVTPDPLLAQTIVHYGHGAGVGAGGTPRVAEAIHWGADHFMFTGAIAPGDSGSGANTVLGDAVGANMQAAGIITHIWISPVMKDGIGIMGGTRATKVGTPTDGQIVPYPIPISGLP